MKFRAKKINGKIDINWQRLELYIARWKEGALFDVEIKRLQRRKSDPLRKYYFAAVLPDIMKGAGYEPDEILDLHKWLKIRYYQIQPDKWGIYRRRDIPSVFGNKSKIPVLGKKEFVDWVIRKAAKAGIYIEDPQ